MVKKESEAASEVQPFRFGVEEGKVEEDKSPKLHTSHADRIRSPRSGGKKLGIVAQRRVDNLLNTQEAILLSKGAAGISRHGRANFEQFVANLPDEAQKEFLNNMETLLDSGRSEVVDDVFKRTQTTYPGTDAGSSTSEVQPSATTPDTPPIPSSGTTHSAPKSPPQTPSPAQGNIKGKNYPLPHPVTHHEHHNCHLVPWLILSGVFGVVADGVNKTTGIATHIMKELSNSYGANAQWGLAVTITNFLAEYIKVVPALIAVATLHKVVDAANECAVAGHISKKDRQDIDAFCEKEIKAISPAHKDFSVDTSKRNKDADEAQARREANIHRQEETHNRVQDTPSDLWDLGGGRE